MHGKVWVASWKGRREMVRFWIWYTVENTEGKWRAEKMGGKWSLEVRSRNQEARLLDDLIFHVDVDA